MTQSAGHPGSAPCLVASVRRGDGGQTSVEVALLLPVIATLLLAVVQVGLVVRAQVMVTHAAREAARVAAVEASTGAPAAAARAAARGLDPTRLQVDVHQRGSSGSRVRVQVRYRMPTDVPLVGGLVGSIELEAEVTMRVE